jgi:F420-0:gamma-glutamyl ligase-like protein
MSIGARKGRLINLKKPVIKNLAKYPFKGTSSLDHICLEVLYVVEEALVKT